LISNTEVIFTETVIAQAQFIAAIMSMSVTDSQRVHHHKTNRNSHRPVHPCRKLPEFAIKLQKQKLFKRVIIKAISAFAQYDGTSTELHYK